PHRAGQTGSLPSSVLPSSVLDALLVPANNAGRALPSTRSTGAPKASYFSVDRQNFNFADTNSIYALIQPSRIGTGFVVDRGGLILTTADVVGANDRVTIR